MRFEAKIGSNGEITIPPDLLGRLKLEPNSAVSVEVTPIGSQPAEKLPDWEAVMKLADELREPMLARMRSQGYNSVDEYIDDIRGR